MLLCGSAALILSDLMPYREMHDLDFVINISHFCSSGLASSMSLTNPYDNSDEDGYTSYSRCINDIEFNVLVFEDSVRLRDKTVSSPHGDIKCQDINDILYWKKKYNRPKDIKDLKNIDDAFEQAIFGGE